MDDSRSAARRTSGDAGDDQPKRHPNLSTGDDREARVDDELLAAGIGPDDPSLHPDRMPFSGEGDATRSAAGTRLEIDEPGRVRGLSVWPRSIAAVRSSWSP